MYQALYRKYRPRTFSDVTGQDHVTVTLRRQIMSGRQSHAYLFVGTRGTGKTTCAKILSRALNCQSPVDGDPCNKCTSCVGIENGSILDVLELDAASNNGVDDVRALREEAIYTPASVTKRVYIIDEAHMLSNSAFNALLKILEEPPEHLVFILATTALHKVPPTILSRCQRFSFKRISPESITERLKFVAQTEGFTLEEDAAKTLAALADGSMRDALSLLDQCASDTIVDLQRVLDTIGLVGHGEVLALIKAASSGDVAAALDVADRLYNDGRDMASLLSEMAALVRDVLVFKLAPESPLQSGGFTPSELSTLSSCLAPERLFNWLDLIREAISSLSRGTGARLTVEMTLIRMSGERLSDDSPLLSSRTEALECGMRNAECGMQNAELAQGSQSVEPQKDNLSSKAIQNEKALIPNTEVVVPPIPNSEFRIPNSDSSEFRIPNSDGFWGSILDLLRSDMSIFSLLSDDTRVGATVQENTLVIGVSDSFNASLIESKKFMDPLTAAAKKILGGNTLVRVEVGGGACDKDKKSKIEDLTKFGVVQFE